MRLLVLLIVYTVASFGFAYIVGHSRMSLPARRRMERRPRLTRLLDLLECPACLGTHVGFWAGLALSLLHVVPVRWFVAAPVAALYTCGAGYLLGRAAGWLKED